MRVTHAQGSVEYEEYLALRGALRLLVVDYRVGHRIGELHKITWEQVDLKAHEIRIQKKQEAPDVADLRGHDYVA
jgi:site-specific recombinase XerC